MNSKQKKSEIRPIKLKIIKLLDELITDCEINNKTQGKKFYINTKEYFTNSHEQLNADGLYNLYRSYCGYVSYGAFNDFDYPKIEQIITLLHSLLKVIKRHKQDH